MGKISLFEKSKKSSQIFFATYSIIPPLSNHLSYTWSFFCLRLVASKSRRIQNFWQSKKNQNFLDWKMISNTGFLSRITQSIIQWIGNWSIQPISKSSKITTKSFYLKSKGNFSKQNFPLTIWKFFSLNNFQNLLVPNLSRWLTSSRSVQSLNWLMSKKR
jgi:hypothetical protein